MAQFNRTLGEIPVEFGGGNRYQGDLGTVAEDPPDSRLAFRKHSRHIPRTAELNPIQERVSPQHKAGECWILEDVGKSVPGPGSEQEWNTIPCLEVPGSDLADDAPRRDGAVPEARLLLARRKHLPVRRAVTHTQVEAQILLVEDGLFRHTKWDNYVAIRTKEERGEKRQDAVASDMVRDRFLIGGGEAYSARGGHRGTKTINTKRDTRHLRRGGFKTAPGTVSVTPRRNKLVYDLTEHIR